MSWLKKLFTQPIWWFWMGMAGVFMFCVALRFWGLDRFNTLVFDEIYYAKFANNYLTHTPFFDGHPPLSKYLIAIGMWIGSYLPFGQDSLNSLTGSLRSTWSYRWLNALTGSLISMVIAGIAYQLSYRKSYAFIAALLAACDGLLLVESRYALNNVYLVLFGLLGQWFFLRGLECRGLRRSFWLALAGIGFGASASIKWNGLGFLLGAYLVWIAAWMIRLLQCFRPQNTSDHRETAQRQSPLVFLTQLNVLHVLFYLAIIPALFYSIEWIPHLQLNPEFGLWEVQKQILAYHERVGFGPKVHPYCSHWYTWPLMLRPVVYFYATAQKITDPLPVMGPLLPASDGKVIYDVHDIGNPFLWWFSTAAILLLLWTLAQRVWFFSSASFRFNVLTIGVNWSPAQTWIALYLILNWLANLLPWAMITRCTFLYHYMEASVFAELALAWLIDHWLQSYWRGFRVVSVTIIFLILLAFVFWMPIYLGLPLSPEALSYRMWLHSWI
jgi:dolichyl-phosphate-mannose--protein O-mannosyl transferase